MLNEMENVGPEIDIQAIRDVEDMLKARLPQDYIEFLLKSNGGEPAERAIDFDGKKLKKGGDYVATFYEVSDDVSYGIKKNMENHGDKVPAGIIFIASSPAGNYFLMSLREDSYGHIYYKDHEIEDKIPFSPLNDQLPESIVKISDSFTEFTTRLYDSDD